MRSVLPQETLRQVPQGPVVAAVAEDQRRFAICKACDHARDDGFVCDLYHSCCLGKFRGNGEPLPGRKVAVRQAFNLRAKNLSDSC